jgi:hypothetical protein
MTKKIPYLLSSQPFNNTQKNLDKNFKKIPAIFLSKSQINRYYNSTSTKNYETVSTQQN